MGIEIINGKPGVEYNYAAGAEKNRKIGNKSAGSLLPGSAGLMVVGEKGYQVDQSYVDEAIEKLRQVGNIFNIRLDFRVDDETNRIVVKVIDTQTDKVIKEIPPEQLIHLAAKIQDMVGLLVDEER
jgi:flagellar protein FlaG